jgi:hypothetical protein
MLAAACSQTPQQAGKVQSSSVVIPTASAQQPPRDDTPAPSSNEGPEPVAGHDDDDADEEAEEDVGPPPLWGNPSGPPGATGGPLCDQAADCCLKMLSATSPNSSLMQTCDTFRNAPTSACSGLLAALAQSAPQLGFACP